MAGENGNPSTRSLLLLVEGDEMPRAEDYRRYAAVCLAIAQRASAPNDRVRLLELANAFNELAARFGVAEDRDEPTRARNSAISDAS